MTRDSLVSWKRVRDKYDDENDGDFTEVRDVKFLNSMKTPEFIMCDETNAKAMRIFKTKW